MAVPGSTRAEVSQWSWGCWPCPCARALGFHSLSSALLLHRAPRDAFCNQSQAELNRFLNSFLALFWSCSPRKSRNYWLPACPSWKLLQGGQEDGFQFRKATKETSDLAPEMFGSQLRFMVPGLSGLVHKSVRLKLKCHFQGQEARPGCALSREQLQGQGGWKGAVPWQLPAALTSPPSSHPLGTAAQLPTTAVTEGGRVGWKKPSTIWGFWSLEGFLEQRHLQGTAQAALLGIPVPNPARSRSWGDLHLPPGHSWLSLLFPFCLLLSGSHSSSCTFSTALWDVDTGEAAPGRDGTPALRDSHRIDLISASIPPAWNRGIVQAGEHLQLSQIIKFICLRCKAEPKTPRNP